MASTQAHTKLLTQAARQVLGPIGLAQRGRSRSWIDDHGWWLCLVDFDSSPFATGSYVNVAAMWLWDDKDTSFHYDVGGRVDDVAFVEFDTPEQFAAAARRLAEVAARAVTGYRQLFSGLRPVAEFLEARTDGENPHRDAASAGIAWGMLGEMAKAEQAFEKAHHIIEGYWRDLVREVASRSDAERVRAAAAGVHFPTRSDLARERPTLNEAHSRVARFELLLSEPDPFRREVLSAISTVRAELKLPPANAELVQDGRA